MLNQFWEVEHNSTANPFSSEEKACEELFLQSVKCHNDGRFIRQVANKARN